MDFLIGGGDGGVVGSGSGSGSGFVEVVSAGDIAAVSIVAGVDTAAATSAGGDESASGLASVSLGVIDAFGAGASGVLLSLMLVGWLVGCYL